MTVGLDRANRNFLALAALVALPYLALVVVGCGLLTVVGLRVADHGFAFATAGPGDLRPALAALGLVGVGTVLAVRALARQLVATRALEDRVDELRMPVDPALSDAAHRLGLDASRLDLVDADQPFSFAYGMARPRVAVSRGLLASTSSDQLDAVLVHERHHVRNLDPLKVVLARVFSAAYFFLPVLRGLRDRYGAASELAADRQAVSEKGSGAIAGALLVAVRGPSWSELATAAAIGGSELLDERAAQLEGAEPPPRPLAPGSVAITVLALAVLLAALLGSIVSLGGPDAVMREAMGGRSDREMGGMTLLGLWPWLAAAVTGAWVVRHIRSRVA